MVHGIVGLMVEGIVGLIGLGTVFVQIMIHFELLDPLIITFLIRNSYSCLLVILKSCTLHDPFDYDFVENHFENCYCYMDSD